MSDDVSEELEVSNGRVWSADRQGEWAAFRAEVGGLERERMKNGLTIEMDVQAVFMCIFSIKLLKIDEMIEGKDENW